MAKLGRYNQLFAENPGTIILSGAFQLNGTSNPDVVSGRGFTVARDDVGKFTVTLEETVFRVFSAVATPALATAAADQHRSVHIAPIDLTDTANSVTIYYSVAGTDTDTDDAQIHFVVFASNTLGALQP